MYDQPSLCQVRSTFSRHVRSTFSRHVRSTFSLSCTVNLLSSCTMSLLSSCTINFLSSCTISLLSSCTINLLSSCTISLLSSCRISTIRIRTRIFIVSVQVYKQIVFAVHSQCTTSSSRVVPPSSSPYLSCTINLLSVMYDQPSFCHVRSTFFLSCMNNLISVMYEQLYHVRLSFSLPLRLTWLTEGE